MRADADAEQQVRMAQAGSTWLVAPCPHGSSFYEASSVTVVFGCSHASHVVVLPGVLSASGFLTVISIVVVCQTPNTTTLSKRCWRDLRADFLREYMQFRIGALFREHPSSEKYA